VSDGENGPLPTVSSVHTVRTHRRNTMEKLDVHTTVDLVWHAHELGLLDLE